MRKSSRKRITLIVGGCRLVEIVPLSKMNDALESLKDSFSYTKRGRRASTFHID